MEILSTLRENTFHRSGCGYAVRSVYRNDKGCSLPTRSTQVVKGHATQARVCMPVVIPPLEWLGNNFDWKTKVIIDLAHPGCSGEREITEQIWRTENGLV
jgi:hypothetical protein